MLAWDLALWGIAPPVIALISGAAYGQNAPVLIYCGVFSLAGAVSSMLGWHYTNGRKELLYDNGSHRMRYVVVYCLCCLISALFPLLPVWSWPVIPLMCALTCFSGVVVGMMSGCTILLIASVLTGSGTLVFFIYFLPSMACCLLFSGITEDFHVEVPIIITHIILYGGTLAGLLLYTGTHPAALSAGDHFTVFVLLLPAVNVIINLILTYPVLKWYNVQVVNRGRIALMDVADPEFPLMIWQREEAPLLYRHSLHMAYFAERIAAVIEADPLVAKASAFYKNAGRIWNESYNEEGPESVSLMRLCEGHNMPEPVSDVLMEVSEGRFISKESTIVMFCDTVVSAMERLLQKHPDERIDIPKVIDVIFDRRGTDGSLKDSRIGINDLDRMKEIFVREELYYDFLRRDGE